MEIFISQYLKQIKTNCYVLNKICKCLAVDSKNSQLNITEKLQFMSKIKKQN